MDFIQQLQTWTKGEIAQGQVMVGIGTLLIPVILLIIRSNHVLLKGMLIPLGLLLLMNLGYGGFLILTRPGKMQQTTAQFHQNPSQMLEKELAKVNGDSRVFATLKPTWAILVIVATLLYFILTRDYYKGLSLGLIGMFWTLLTLDTFFHSRLKIYLNAIQELITQP